MNVVKLNFSIKMETNSIDLIHVESTYKISLVYKCIRWRKNMSCNSKQIVIVMVCQCWISSNGVCDVEGTDTHVRLMTFSYNWKNSYKTSRTAGYMHINRNCLIRKIFGKWTKNKLNSNSTLWKDGTLYSNKIFYFNLVFYKYFLYNSKKLLV